MKKLLTTLLSLCISLACISCQNANKECRYFVIHRDIPHSSQLNESFLTEIVDAVGQVQNDTLRLGVSIVISMLGDQPDEQVAKLRKITELSEKTNIPIYI